MGYIEQALVERLPTREERIAEEERRAWDMYVAGVLADTNATKDLAVVTADYVLAERRKRFGAGRVQDVQPDPDAATPPAPVGSCPRCGIRHYATVGTCGACGWPNPR